MNGIAPASVYPLRVDKHRQDKGGGSEGIGSKQASCKAWGRGASPNRTRKGVNVVDHQAVDRLVARGRPGLEGALVASGLLLGLLLVLWAAPGASAQSAGPDGPERVFALSAEDHLLRFDGDNPGQVAKKEITGLSNGESLVGIDFRPSGPDATQGKLYGLGDQGYIYRINQATAVASRGPQITADGAPVALRGTRFGIDFNPTVDRLRIVSDANQNLRVNVDTGELSDFNATIPGTQPDQDVQYAVGNPNVGQEPKVTGVAYRNARPAAFGTTSTELYDIDAQTDDMSEQDPPNDGTLNTEGPVSIDTSGRVGFDIVTRGDSSAGDRGYASMQPLSDSVPSFYKVNLNTGRATKIGTFGARNVEGIAIPIGQQ